jgi:hypothetical protein
LKVLFDEGVPEALAEHLPGHEVSTVKRQGWRSIKNGKLLDLIESTGFEAFLTNDKRIVFEQQLLDRPFATLILSVSNWNIIRERVTVIASALDEAEPGTVTKVDCGTFVPKRFRKPEGPGPA